MLSPYCSYKPRRLGRVTTSFWKPFRKRNNLFQEYLSADVGHGFVVTCFECIVLDNYAYNIKCIVEKCKRLHSTKLYVFLCILFFIRNQNNGGGREENERADFGFNLLGTSVRN